MNTGWKAISRALDIISSVVAMLPDGLQKHLDKLLNRTGHVRLPGIVFKGKPHQLPLFYSPQSTPGYRCRTISDLLSRKMLRAKLGSLLETSKAEFRERYNQRWIVQRLGNLTPTPARQQFLALGAAA